MKRLYNPHCPPGKSALRAAPGTHDAITPGHAERQAGAK